MTIESIVAEIDAEIAKLTKVRALLASSGKMSLKLTKTRSGKLSTTRKKRVLSPEARKRIADAQRRRWAAQRAKSK